LVFALALALVACAGLGWRYLAVPLVLCGAIALPPGTVKAVDGGRILFEGESEHQYIRVIEDDDGDRLLELNEGQAVHSMLRPGSFLTADYWDSFLVLPFTAREQPPRRVAILGNAAGTIARAYGHYFPETEVDGVEIDSELTEVGYRFFDMGSNENLTVHNEDARPWLRQADGEYDLIVVDAYRQPYIPFYLVTKEFFELVRDRLSPGGVVVVNVGHPEDSTAFEEVMGRTMAEVFPAVLRDPAEQTNTLLLGSEADASPERLDAAAHGPYLHGNLADLAVIDAARMGQRLPGGEVYTDDRAPVEWLIDRSILGYAGGE
jgi:spermidine synthase